jgi:hypothetical protein
MFNTLLLPASTTVLLFSSENGLFVGGLPERQGRKRIKWLALANPNAAKRPVYPEEVTR